MSRARVLLVALVGLALPVGLALGVYVASEGSLGAVPAVVEVPGAKVARGATTETQPVPTTTGATTTVAGDDDARDALPGKCRKPENQLDPDCDPRSADDDDSSGRGSGDDGDSGGDEDSSGPGSGDDDGGDDDSSGPGSGDDD